MNIKSKLNILGLSNNKLDSQREIRLALNSLAGEHHLVELSIEKNVIGNHRLQAIVKALKECCNIKEFHLYNYQLEEEPLNDFTNLLSKQSDIFVIGLEFNRLGHKGLI